MDTRTTLDGWPVNTFAAAIASPGVGSSMLLLSYMTPHGPHRPRTPKGRSRWSPAGVHVPRRAYSVVLTDLAKLRGSSFANSR